VISKAFQNVPEYFRVGMRRSRCNPQIIGHARAAPAFSGMRPLSENQSP
jgi:hypothetical protein